MVRMRIVGWLLILVGIAMILFYPLYAWYTPTDFEADLPEELVKTLPVKDAR